MTDEQLKIIIAEHCGWDCNPEEAKDWDSSGRWIKHPQNGLLFNLANVLVEAEDNLTDNQFKKYIRACAVVYLKVIGKWEGESDE
jgi:hypothetical protein